MYLINELIHKYDLRMYEQGRSLASTLSMARCQGFSQEKRIFLYCKFHALDTLFRVERAAALIFLASAVTITSVFMPAGLILSPALLFKSSTVSQAVKKFFKLLVHEFVVFKNVVISLFFSTYFLKNQKADLKFSWMKAINEPISSFTGKQSELEAVLLEQVIKSESFDKKLTKNNKNIPPIRNHFEAFLKENSKHLKFTPSKIYVQNIESFSTQEEKIAKIVADYLHVLFQIPVELSTKKETCQTIIDKFLQIHKSTGTWGTLGRLKKHLSEIFPRRLGSNLAYEGNAFASMLNSVIQSERKQSDEAIIGIVRASLYTEEKIHKPLIVSDQAAKTAICSLEDLRSGDKNKGFEILLKRILKIASHEMARFASLPTCKSYLCGLNTSENLQGLDQKHLLLCSKDLAKIAYFRKNITLLDLYKKLYQFFETFEQQYGMKCNFTNEKKYLQKRIFAMV